MDQMHALDHAIYLKKQGGVPNELVVSWDRINKDALHAYNKLYALIRKKYKHEEIPVPEVSRKLLEMCAPDRLVDDLRNRLVSITKNDQQFLTWQTEYLILVNQLVAVAYFIIEEHDLLADPSGESAGVDGDMEDNFSRTANPSVSSGINYPVEGSPASRPNYPQPQPVTPLQKSLEDLSQSAADQLDHALAAVAEAQKYIDGLSHHMSEHMPQLVMRGDWDELLRRLYSSDLDAKNLQVSVTRQIVDAITDLEHQYGQAPVSSANRFSDERAQFEAAIRTLITRLEVILNANYGIERIPIAVHSEVDSRYMDWDTRNTIDPTSTELAGRIAQVVAPGYWVKVQGGDPMIYRRAKVVLFKANSR